MLRQVKKAIDGYRPAAQVAVLNYLEDAFRQKGLQ